MVMARLRLAGLAFALLWAQWLGLNHAICNSITCGDSTKYLNENALHILVTKND